jgi:hypothetical protein
MQHALVPSLMADRAPKAEHEMGAAEEGGVEECGAEERGVEMAG